MTPDVARAKEENEEEEGGLSRVLGEVSGETPGPTLICIAGIHGNEPAGIAGLRRVFNTFQSRQPALAGLFIGLAGNLQGLARGSRYMQSDLNRTWSPRRVAEIDSVDDLSTLEGEAREQKELLFELRRAFARSRGDIRILDLHTTSGEGAPFAVLNDTLPNRAFALALPVPIVLGVAENLAGTLMHHVNDLGYVNCGFEAGQHDDPEAIDNAEAAVWIALAAAGCIAGSEPEVARSNELLTRARGGLPRVLEVRHRHPVSRGDGFRMRPGFANFQRIKQGQLLAHDRRGEVRSNRSGRVLMPLYQDLGEDGFFLVKELRPLWLKISAFLRRLRLDSHAHWLPGVKRHPDHPETLIVDRNVARWFAVELFHLFGFRKHRALGNVLLVSRRAHAEPPHGRGALQAKTDKSGQSARSLAGPGVPSANTARPGPGQTGVITDSPTKT